MSEQKFEHFQQVLVRDHEESVWVCALFSHYNEDKEVSRKYICTGGDDWQYCISYKGNEHLVGTCESPIQEEKLEFGDKILVSDDTVCWKKALFIKMSDENRFVAISKVNCAEISWKYCKKGWGDNDSK